MPHYSILDQGGPPLFVKDPRPQTKPLSLLGKAHCMLSSALYVYLLSHALVRQIIEIQKLFTFIDCLLP